MKYIFLALNVFLFIGCSSAKKLENKTTNFYKIENSNGKEIMVPRQKRDTISPGKYQKLKEYLTEINDHDLDFNKKIVINFIDNDPYRPSNNYQVNWDIFDGDLEKELNSIEPSNHIWILNNQVKNLYYYHGEKINWMIDKNNLVRELFFNYNGLNGGFLIIKPNRNYSLLVGEYSKLEELNALKEFK